ncbi:ABC transporter substrate-binding protein [Thalassospira lucentensis]|uniref:ABC transporter substrate-binding protein n=1 Tax=Thalassospira lucentensis TaxID=168935 RepID=UPI0020CA5714|nr:iron-siderophore ABC transporter substrate-binding protein [Thalassospira lucentensis]
MTFFRLFVLAVVMTAVSAISGLGIHSATASPIVINDDRGTVTLDAAATRVAVINWGLAESVLALGLDPVAIADPQDYQKWVGKPDLPQSFVDLGARAAPNIEALRNAKPDLILISQELDIAYDKLSDIAPVMVFSIYADGNIAFDSATDAFRKIAKATGREKEGEAYLKQVDDKLAAYGDRIRAVLGPDQEIAVANFYSPTNIAVFGSPSLPGSVMKQMNVPLAYDGPVSKWGFARGGLEILAPLAKNTLVYTNPIPDTVRQKTWASPLWKSMDFVRNNRVYELPVVWGYGGVPSGLRFAELLTKSLENGPTQ